MTFEGHVAKFDAGSFSPRSASQHARLPFLRYLGVCRSERPAGTLIGKPPITVEAVLRVIQSA